MPASIRADLFHGAAYGLAASAAIWTVALSPPPADPSALLLVGLGAALGSIRWRTAVVRRSTSVFPTLLAALLLYGPAVSLAAGVLATLATVWAGTSGGARSLARRAAFDLSRVVLCAAMGAAVYGYLGGRVIETPDLAILGPMVGHAAGFGALWIVLTWTSTGPGARGRGRPWRFARPALQGYLAGLCLAWVVAWSWTRPGPRVLVVTAILIGLMQALHRARREHGELGRNHDLQSASVYRSITHALGKLIEAKDNETRQHLRRVHRLSLDVGKKMGLSARELEALGAAATLHDLGKIAIPEGILSKPGRLTQEEMEHVKAHPGVGADILQVIPFPCSPAPIVRHHHERWDGRGYPAGLRGEEIPLGSRILTVVDTYDALISDRPYRRALPRDEVETFLLREAGRMFDPRVIEALLSHLAGAPASLGSVRDADDAPLAEQARADEPPSGGHLPLAERELQTLYDIARVQGHGLDLEEYLTLVACKLSSIVPHQSLVVYLLDPGERVLQARFAMGKAADKLRLMSIPLGERLSGWAALQGRAFVGHDHMTPLDRDGWRSDLEDWWDDEEMSSLGSTLVAPLAADGCTIGALTLYDHSPRRYTPGERGILIRVAGHVAEFIRRTGGRPRTDESGFTDPITGVPNARFLWRESSQRISRLSEEMPGFGLLTFRVHGLEEISERVGNEATDRYLSQIARRFAANCRAGETPVRFGHDLFIILTPTHRSEELAEREHDLAASVAQPAIGPEGTLQPVRLTGAHASCPDDGPDLDSLLSTLDRRLADETGEGGTVVPFRAPVAAEGVRTT